MLNDQALASAIANGDQQAYQQAVASHGRAIRSVGTDAN